MALLMRKGCLYKLHLPKLKGIGIFVGHDVDYDNCSVRVYNGDRFLVLNTRVKNKLGFTMCKIFVNGIVGYMSQSFLYENS